MPLTVSQIETRVLKLLSDEWGLDPKMLTLDAQLGYDLGFEEIDLVELLMLLEQRFKIEIDDDQIEQLETVQDVVQYLTRRLVR